MNFSNQIIDKSTPIPMYFQLKQIILDRITAGELKPGDMIPTELEFIELFDVSRTTVRQAIIELVKEGYLYRTKGKGTFVAKPKIKQDFMQKLEGFAAQMRRLNLTPRTEVLSMEVIPAPEWVAIGLNIYEGDQVIKMTRLRYADEEPVVIVDTYLTENCKFITESDLEKFSLYSLLSRTPETRVVMVERQVEAVLPTEEDIKILRMPAGEAIQLVTTTGYNEEGTPVEYSISHYRGDKNQFIVKLRV